MYHFETIDMVKAKEALEGIACLMGGIPNSLLVGGSPEEVREYCQKTIEIAGQDGGYIIASGALIDEANPENLKMMFDVAHDHIY